MTTLTTDNALTVAANRVRRVYSLNVNSERFVEVELAGGGLMSILRMMGEETEAQSLFRAADDEMEKARQAFKRAATLRKAAWVCVAKSQKS